MNEINNSEQNNAKSNAARLASLIKRAGSLLESGSYDKAIERIREAMTISPRDARCYIQLSKAYKAQNKIGPAIDAMQRAVEIDPSNTTVREQLLRTLLEIGRYDEAISISCELLKQLPKNVFVRDVLGIIYLQQGELDKALQITNELIRLDPVDPAHHFKKAVLLQQKGQITEAMQAFIRSLEMDPEGDMADDAREAIAALDSYQLRQILTIAVEDAVFKTKLILDPDSAARERGFLLSSGGVAALKQIDLDDLPGDAANRYYH